MAIQMMAAIEIGSVVLKAKSINGISDAFAASTTSPEVGARIIAAGDAQIAAAAPRLIPTLTITGNSVAISNTPSPVAEETASDIRQATKYAAIISKWSGVSFTDQQKADYVAGKAVKLENVTDKQGFHATMYIKFNPEKGRPYRYDTNPDNAQQVAPSNESRTQVAVNNDGKTNEATKNLREPLQKGQTNPKDARQQQQQEKPQKKTGKGMKM